MRSFTSGIPVFALLAASAACGQVPYWVEPMKAVNLKFEGNPGYVAQFGDSITYSMAFWTPIGWDEPDQYLTKDDGLPKRPKDKRWRDTFKGFQAKGPENANYSGWHVGEVLGAMDAVLKREQPEAALIMIGTNDISGGNVPGDYHDGLMKIVRKCLDAHCIPVLNTIPPRRGFDTAVEAANIIIRDVAQEMKVPLADFYAECLRLRPGKSWDNTIIGDDGVHPSPGQINVYTEENMKVCGYALRNWVNFLAMRELYFRVLSSPKAFVEKVGPVDPVRQGIRCEVIADTEVSSSEGERNWNWGKAQRLKLKGFEEYVLLKFDLSQCKGLTVDRATLYLSRTEQCVVNVTAPSTVSADWAEGDGTGAGSIGRGGATFLHAISPNTPWAGPGSDFKHVVFGEGGSSYEARPTGWARDDKGDYYSVELPRSVIHGMLVDGDSYGMALTDEKGQRGFQSTYRRVPNPNHFIYSRESAHPCFLIVEGKRIEHAPPAPVANATASPGPETGDIDLKWTCTRDDRGQRVLGYRVYLSQKPLGSGDLVPGNLLPRYLTYRPLDPALTQSFPVRGLAAGTEYHFLVFAYDEAGSLSTGTAITGTTRAARIAALPAMSPAPDVRGKPLENARLRVWAAPSNAQINPLTGGTQADRLSGASPPAGAEREGNAIYNGRNQTIELVAGRNDFAGFQIAVENLAAERISGLQVQCEDLVHLSTYSKMNRYILMAVEDPGRFQNLLRQLKAGDPASADRVLSEVKRFGELKRKQLDTPDLFFQEMETLRQRDAGEYDNWMQLLSGKPGGGSGRIAAKNVTIDWEYSVRGAADAWYPDALVPCREPLAIPNIDNRIPGQRVQSFYVDIWVPHDTPPGEYSGQLTVACRGAEDLTVPVNLTVGSFMLPDTLSFICDMNGYGYPDFKSWDGALALHRLAHRNRLNVDMVPYSHSGNWTVPQTALQVMGKGDATRVTSFDDFDRYFGPLLSGKAFAGNPRAGVPIPAMYLPLYENWPCLLKDGFTFDQSAQHADITQDFSDEYKQGYLSVCRQVADHLKKRGYDRTEFQVFLNDKYPYAPDITFWLLDEPMFRDDYMVLSMFSKLAREGFKDAAPVQVDFRVDCSRVEEVHGMFTNVDLFVGANGNAREYRKLLEDQAAAYIPKPGNGSRKTWVYGGTSKPSEACTADRSWAIEAYLAGYDGIVPWLAYGGDDAWDSAEAAENAIFYPAAKRWDEDGCYGSLRMKAFRDGQQDVEYMNLLCQKTGLARSDLAMALAKVLPKSPEPIADHPYRGLSPNDLARFRRWMAEILDR